MKAKKGLASKSQTSNNFENENNIALSKELAKLRIANSKLQQDLRDKIAENINLKVKCNNTIQIVSNINSVSKIALSKIVEASSELTYVMKICNSFINNKFMDLRSESMQQSQVSCSPRVNNSQKQVIPPHAVNGHVIHTPTVRLARYNDNSRDSTQETTNYQGDGENSEIIDGLDRVEEEEEIEENSPQEEVEEDSDYEENEEKDLGEEESSEEENDYLEEMDVQDETMVDQIGALSVISEKSREIEDQVQSLTSLCSRDALLDNTLNHTDINSSMLVEPSTSFSDSMRFNENTSSTINRKSNSPTRRKSFIERKSIGSPMPSRVQRKSNEFVRQTTPNSLPSTSGVAFNSIQNNSKRSGNEGRVEENETTCMVSSLRSFIAENSLHSTPLSDQPSNNSQNLKRSLRFSKVNVAKRRLQKDVSNNEPVIVLTKFELSDVEKENKRVSLDCKSKIFKKCEEYEEKLLLEHQIKQEDSKPKCVRKKKSELLVVPQIKREESPVVEKSSRPKRLAKPLRPLTETNLKKKLRRSR